MLPSAAVAQITIRQGTPSEDANVLRVESWQTTSLAAALVLVIVVAIVALRRWVRGGPEHPASALALLAGCSGCSTVRSG